MQSDDPEASAEQMKLRKPLVLRSHQFKQSSDAHDFYYSELLLYYPHKNNDELFPDDLEMCRNKYLDKLDEINYVKSIVMPHLQRVEEGQARAMEIAKDEEAIGNLLDAQKQQDDEECEDEGLEIEKEFIALNPDDVQSELINKQDALKYHYLCV